jgi:hypothetical protein
MADQVTTQFVDLQTARKAHLTAVMMDAIKTAQPLYRDVFRMEKAGTKGLFENETQVSGFSALSQHDELVESGTDRLYPGYPTTWTFVEYSLLWRYSEKLLRHDMDGLLKKGVRNLALLPPDHIDTTFWNHLNNAFSVAESPDSTYLVSTAHVNHRNETKANRLTNGVDFGYGNWQLLANMMRTTTDHSGYRYLDFPKNPILIGSIYLQWAFEEVFPSAGGSIYRPDSEYRGTNVNKVLYTPSKVTTPKITDTDAWFICGGKEMNEIKGKMANGIRIQHGPKDISTGAYEIMIDVEYDTAVADWLGWWGSPGQ